MWLCYKIDRASALSYLADSGKSQARRIVTMRIAALMARHEISDAALLMGDRLRPRLAVLLRRSTTPYRP